MVGQLVAFTIAAALLTVTPGLDTALILRTSVSEGSRRAFMAGLGIAAGCFGWGLLVAVGLGTLLQTSGAAYDLLRWIGAAYLLYLGIKLLRSPRREFAVDLSGPSNTSAPRWLLRGFLTNILNPKVGIFYVSFLPQFIPSGTNVSAMAVLLTSIHAALGVIWFTLLIGATRSISALLQRRSLITSLDRITGGVFLAFGAKLALSARH